MLDISCHAIQKLLCRYLKVYEPHSMIYESNAKGMIRDMTTVIILGPINGGVCSVIYTPTWKEAVTFSLAR